MNLRQQNGKEAISLESRAIVVAVEACSEISKTALKWALLNVVQPGDFVKLLVIIPTHTSGKKLWGLPKFHIPKFPSDCTPGYWNSLTGTLLDQREYITDLCNQMMDQLGEIYDPEKIKLRSKVIYGSTYGVVASEAMRIQTQWVVLDKRMKREAKFCMEKLECNIVVVKNSEPKILRLNFTELNKPKADVLSHSKSSKQRHLWKTIKVPNVTPTSSPDHESFMETSARISSISSLDMFFTSPKEIHREPKTYFTEFDFDESDSDSDSDIQSTLSTSMSSSSADEGSKRSVKCHQRSANKTSNSIFGSCQEKFSLSTEMISLNKNTPPDSPPLCSVCRHKAPTFGKPPRLFSYSEIDLATNGFSQSNFLAEGGFGSVYRGVLPDGQVIAVKQHKLASNQGDREFCSEVQVLSCAQHRNVVMLIGFCIEDKRRLLVYEYICNGSLDTHLYGRSNEHLEWAARQKIAVGTARGLTYLHDECRVGCIVHRDMRPNNILLTHDFEPLVGDFGLAKLQPDGDLSVKTRIIGTFGYLAPEYVQTGQVSEKADVYSFGVVLVELITGRKAVDMNRPKGEQCLVVWARPLLEENAVSKLVDPCMMKSYSEREVKTMLLCASLCLQQDPQLRPRMSQVHRLLDGESFVR